MVNTPHGDYNANLVKWQRCRHVLGGEDSVKAATTLYLPKLDGQTPDDYAAYLMRALFFNATSRTVDSFVGMIFRKKPVEEVPDVLKPFLDDANMRGTSWFDYEKSTVREVIGVGRSGTFVEWSEEESRPYACTYQAEQIINWRESRIKGRMILSMIVLQEEVDAQEAQKMLATGAASNDQSKTVAKPAKAPKGVYDTAGKTGVKSAKADEFTQNTVKQIRVLKLVTDGVEPVFTVEIWQKIHEKSDDYSLMLTLTPQRKGKPLRQIPFVFHGPNNLSTCVERPPIDDIVSINLSHYRSSADLEHGRHFTGLPTAFAAGFDTDKTYKIGSAVAWLTKEPSAKAAYLEFTGQGLQALDKALEQKEHQMAVLGARMLEHEKKAVETQEVLQMKQTGEQSTLSQIVSTCNESFELILRWALWWYGAADSDLKDTDDQVEVELNTDFNPTDMNPQLVTAIIAAVQSGLLSKDSAVTAFKRGELVSGVRTVEEELALIELDAPKLQGDPKPLPK